MIVTIDNEIFTALKNALPTVTTVRSYPSTPVFPCVVFSELSNNSYNDTKDSAGEHHNELSFEIIIYSNAENKLTQIKTIRSTIDSIMSGTYNMTRGFSGDTPNFLDASVDKYTFRYSCVCDENKTIYRG